MLNLFSIDFILSFIVGLFHRMPLLHAPAVVKSFQFFICFVSSDVSLFSFCVFMLGEIGVACSPKRNLFTFNIRIVFFIRVARFF